MVLAINLGLEVHHVDVVTAFVNAELEAEVYVRLLDDLVQLFPFLLPKKLGKLKTSMYGLKRVARD